MPHSASSRGVPPLASARLTAGGRARTIALERSPEGVAMVDATTADRGRWQRRVLGAILPAGIVLLAAWVIAVALPTARGAEPPGLSVASMILGLVTSAILIVTGYGYRRSVASPRSRHATTYDAGRPHPFVAARDSGLAAVASGGGFARASGGQADAVATTNRYQRMAGCAVPGCGRPADAEIHAPAEDQPVDPE